MANPSKQAMIYYKTFFSNDDGDFLRTARAAKIAERNWVEDAVALSFSSDLAMAKRRFVFVLEQSELL